MEKVEGAIAAVCGCEGGCASVCLQACVCVSVCVSVFLVSRCTIEMKTWVS